MARVKLRVSNEESALAAKKSELESLREDVSALNDSIAGNISKAAEKRNKADALITEAENTRACESVRKDEIAKAVETANTECQVSEDMICTICCCHMLTSSLSLVVQEVVKLRESIENLTVTQAALANDLKHKLDNKESNILAMDADIASTRDELALIEKQSGDHKGNEDSKRVKVLAEIESAKKMADIIKNAYERAQKDANDFTALPDEELATEMKHLDEMEENVIEDANRERDELIKSKYDC